jgi:hypothetical protein
VKSLSKPGKRNSGDIFVEAEVGHNVGIVRFVGENLQGKFVEGQKVAIGNQREQIRIGGEDIMVMEETNVYALIEDQDVSGENV